MISATGVITLGVIFSAGDSFTKHNLIYNHSRHYVVIECVCKDDIFVPAAGIIMTKLSDYSVAVSGKVSLNFGPEMDALWIGELSPGHLHLCRYHEATQQLQEIWDKVPPQGHLWDCIKLIYNNTILLQSYVNEVIQYRYDDLHKIQQLSSPGDVCGLTAGGLAVVDNRASPSSATEGLRLHVTQATDLRSYVHSLEIPPAGPYGRMDHLHACGTQEGRIAIGSREKKCIDFYGLDGE